MKALTLEIDGLKDGDSAFEPPHFLSGPTARPREFVL